MIKYLKILISGCLLAYTLAHAQTKPIVFNLDSPYTPSQEIEDTVSLKNTWGEVYFLKNKKADALINSLMQGQIPETTVGIIASPQLYVSINSRSLSFSEESVSVTRKGVDIEYDEKCAIIPEIGDKLYSVHTFGQFSIEISANIKKHLSFGYLTQLSTEPTQLDLKNPANCDKETSSRLFFEGTMTLKRNGKQISKNSILLQTITEN